MNLHPPTPPLPPAPSPDPPDPGWDGGLEEDGSRGVGGAPTPLKLALKLPFPHAQILVYRVESSADQGGSVTPSRSATPSVSGAISPYGGILPPPLSFPRVSSFPSSSSLTSLLTSDDTREAHSFLESDQY